MQIVRIGDGSAKLHSAESIGAKAANLARVAALGLPVPPAFVLPVKLCAAIAKGDAHAERDLTEGLREGIEFLESVTGRHFGDRRRPLLVSVRSGAARSMPGMLDTVLNVGCTEAATRGLVRMTGNPRFAWDCRRRFLESFAGVVLGLDPAPFAARRAELIATEHANGESDLDSAALEALAAAYRALVEDDGFPDDPMEQLAAAARAVFSSWTSDRARAYRRLEHFNHLEGTAVTVQAMVFGNRGLSSGAGVAFSRDPSTGGKEPMIDVLFDSQGEDVVSGRRTPETEAAIVRAFPSIAAELRSVLAKLEREFSDVQDIEFTIEDGTLWVLQTRSAKRTPRAALRIAIDLVHEKLIAPREALKRLEGLNADALAHTRLEAPGDPAARGIGASGGVAAGRATFDSASAEKLAAGGEPVILVRPDTSTSDVAGFAASAGIVTSVGGRTAHAALVARQMGKPCIVGCREIVVDIACQQAQLGGATLRQGEWISVDGDSGAVYVGRREIVTERPDAELAEVASWRAEVRHSAPQRSLSG